MLDLMICSKCRLPYDLHLKLGGAHCYNPGVPRSSDEQKQIAARVAVLRELAAPLK